MIRDAARSLWAEPRAPDPPARVWRDWALVAALVPVAVLEGVIRDDLVWHIASVAVTFALLPSLLWRRSHPLVAVVVAFGLLTVVDVVSLAVGTYWKGLARPYSCSCFPMRCSNGAQVAKLRSGSPSS